MQEFKVKNYLVSGYLGEKLMGSKIFKRKWGVVT